MQELAGRLYSMELYSPSVANELHSVRGVVAALTFGSGDKASGDVGDTTVCSECSEGEGLGNESSIEGVRGSFWSSVSR